MLLIECPYCGQRDETEFNCGGESHIQRPGLDSTDSTWADYLFYRGNPAGITFERWCHGFGCGRWFNVARCTVSHKIHAVYAMTDPRPDI
ncbi:sarcosine oxidase subunit delta [Sphingorhabdus sp.]|jgi:sarcosine oxidase subunit delta|uniref:sarcosine oxidase subunit delta n=1 Tax=Sphingorhabdus sp. TaxID=1902408 RepID=UPI0037C7CB73